MQVVSATGSAGKSKQTGANAVKLIKIKALTKKVDSTGTDEATDKHEKKTTKRRPFKNKIIECQQIGQQLKTIVK